MNRRQSLTDRIAPEGAEEDQDLVGREALYQPGCFMSMGSLSDFGWLALIGSLRDFGVSMSWARSCLLGYLACIGSLSSSGRLFKRTIDVGHEPAMRFPKSAGNLLLGRRRMQHHSADLEPKTAI